MKAAQVYSELSYCRRKKVGCVVVKDHKVISIGYNGTPPGEDNCCEDNYNKTLPHVIHAEDNVLRKLKGNEAEGASLFVTTAPCIECAKKIIKAKIKDVYYLDIYRSSDGIDHLIDNNINCSKLTPPVTMYQD